MNNFSIFARMETWEMDFKWLRVRHFLKDTFNKSDLPGLEAILFLIGVRELGQAKRKFKKEEKMQLMQDAASGLLSKDGYFKLNGKDEKGWPLWEKDKALDLGEREKIDRLKVLIIEYFEEIIPVDDTENIKQEK